MDLSGILAISAGVVVDESLEPFFDLSGLSTVEIGSRVCRTPIEEIAAAVFFGVEGGLNILKIY